MDRVSTCGFGVHFGAKPGDSGTDAVNRGEVRDRIRPHGADNGNQEISA